MKLTSKSTPAILSALLVLAVAVVYSATLAYDFSKYDDHLLITQNPAITQGVSFHTVVWAFTTDYENLWYPMTWLSYILDYQLYGQNPWGYHLTNILLHAAATVLLFDVLRRITNGVWPSFLAAALFALHPLQVETVAWIGERKGVLSGLFFMLTLEAYLGYVRRPFSLWRYAAVCAAFALGLMAKPVLVTMPALLLLLDFWPLKRSLRLQYLIAEKLPLMLLVAGSCYMTIWSEGKNIRPMAQAPVSVRIEGVLVSYATYLVEIVRPVHLIPFYPRSEGDLTAAKVLASGVLLLGISAAVAALRRKNPALLVGWLWFLGTLLPMIGVMQIGSHGRADRYMYLPMIGLAIAAAWGSAPRNVAGTLRGPSAASAASYSPILRQRASGAAWLTVLVIFMGLSWQQASYWRNRESLWIHTLRADPRNYMAHNNVGNVLADRGQKRAAIYHYQKALEAEPSYEMAHYNLAHALAERGDVELAIIQYQEALEISPDDAKAHNNLGLLFAAQGRYDEAIGQYQAALKIAPNYAMAHFNLGGVLAVLGQFDAAIAHLQEAVNTNPDYTEASRLLDQIRRQKR
jgi:tetratricopeptide (TPR) repeat protein